MIPTVYILSRLVSIDEGTERHDRLPEEIDAFIGHSFDPEGTRRNR